MLPIIFATNCHIHIVIFNSFGRICRLLFHGCYFSIKKKSQFLVYATHYFCYKLSYLYKLAYTSYHIAYFWASNCKLSYFIHIVLYKFLYCILLGVELGYYFNIAVFRFKKINFWLWYKFFSLQFVIYKLLYCILLGVYLDY